MSLNATNLSVSAGGQRVLEEIDFTLDPGQIVAVLGPNGAGKSSLLRAMSNEWQAAAGQVQLHPWQSFYLYLYRVQQSVAPPCIMKMKLSEKIYVLEIG